MHVWSEAMPLFPIESIDECRDEAGHFVGIEIRQDYGKDEPILYHVSPLHPAPHSGKCPGSVRREPLYPRP
jgi:hypothetical protein